MFPELEKMTENDRLKEDNMNTNELIKCPKCGTILGRSKQRERGLRIRWSKRSKSKGSQYIYLDVKTPALIKCRCGEFIPISPYFEDLVMLRILFEEELPKKLGLKSRRRIAASKLLERKGLGKIAKYKEGWRKSIQEYIKKDPENLTKLIDWLKLK